MLHNGKSGRREVDLLQRICYVVIHYVECIEQALCHCSFQIFMPRLGGAYCFRRVRSQRKSVDWGTMGPALGGAYECYAHISS